MSLYLGTDLVSGVATPIQGARNIGQIIQSTIPLTDAGLHLLDGSLISGSGSYSAFVTYIAGLVSSYPDLFETEANWQQSVTTYGVCGKFVYDSVNNTVRLPKITGFTEGTIDPTVLGDLVQAGLPNITGSSLSSFFLDFSDNANSAIYGSTASQGAQVKLANGGYGASGNKINVDASRSSSIYGNSTTVQPQAIKVLYYIVIATSTKTNIEVDIDDIATDLNGKADVDLTNVNASGTALASGWGMPSSRYIDLTLGAGGSTYTAPANGWFTLGGAGGWFSIYDASTNLTLMQIPKDNLPYPRGFLPARKGAVITIDYYGFTVETFRFIYAEGEN